MEQFYLFGKYGALSLAEIFSLIPEKRVLCLAENFVCMDSGLDEKEILKSSGGIVKTGVLLKSAKSEAEILENLEQAIENLEIKNLKLSFGVSFVGNFSVPFKRKIKEATKAILKSRDIKSRFLDNKTDVLAAATLKFNKVLEEGFEFVVIKDQGLVFLGKTTAFQDIDKWSKKDFGRPKRDTAHGLIQPKLARMMINIARRNEEKEVRILDPFCGSGTIVQEALDLGLEAFGSDIDEQSVEFSKKNMEWFCREFDQKFDSKNIFLHDAKRDFDTKYTNFFSSLVAEPFMGSQISRSMDINEFLTRQKQLLILYQKAFSNFHAILKPHGTVIFAFPITKVEGKFRELSFEGKIAEKGFRIIPPAKFCPEVLKFKKVTSRGFEFGLDDQFVKREIVLLEKI